MMQEKMYGNAILTTHRYKGYRIIHYQQPLYSLQRYGVVDQLHRLISYSESFQQAEEIINNLTNLQES